MARLVGLSAVDGGDEHLVRADDGRLAARRARRRHPGRREALFNLFNGAPGPADRPRRTCAHFYLFYPLNMAEEQAEAEARAPDAAAAPDDGADAGAPAAAGADPGEAGAEGEAAPPEGEEAAPSGEEEHDEAAAAAGEEEGGHDEVRARSSGGGALSPAPAHDAAPGLEVAPFDARSEIRCDPSRDAAHCGGGAFAPSHCAPLAPAHPRPGRGTGSGPGIIIIFSLVAHFLPPAPRVPGPISHCLLPFPRAGSAPVLRSSAVGGLPLRNS